MMAVAFIFTKDRLNLRKIKNATTLYRPLQREKIASDFRSFKTEYTRTKYIQLIETKKIIPTGSWPEGKLPNFNNDRSSSLLAQLEETWLGLDR